MQSDGLDPTSLLTAMTRVSAAYYLIHSMSGSADFDQRDIQAARAKGVERIIYLGGLGDPATDLSKHLRSRQQTGQALQEAGVPVTEFRAAIVVGSGSISFKMIRYLTERVPVMICPRWVFTRVQLVAIGIVSAPPNVVFKMISRLGGQTGWLYLNWAWRLRGWIDRLVGGMGLRRGRRDPELVRIGDAIDFWRVESVEPDKRLLLRAEMKLPGRAWLHFITHPHSGEQTRLVQTAFFAPRGLFGLAYWYLLHPTHRLIFAGMIRSLAQRALETTPKGKYE